MLIVEVSLLVVALVLVFIFRKRVAEQFWVAIIILIVGFSTFHYALVKYFFTHSIFVTHTKTYIGSVVDIKKVSSSVNVDFGLRILDVASDEDKYVLAVDDSQHIVAKGEDFELETTYLRYMNSSMLCRKNSDTCIPLIYIAKVRQ